MLWSGQVPKVTRHDEKNRAVEITVVAGPFGDAVPGKPPPSSWASKGDSHVAIWPIRMTSGSKLTLPPAVEGVNRTLYFFSGRSLSVAGASFGPGTAIKVRSDAKVELENGEGEGEGEVLVLQGRPINEPVVQYGPFVMNTPEEIQQAFSDYRRTQFGGWPWPSHEPVHPKTSERFAKHADGKIEKAS
jgi:redox-sensitive bicupin YhaK (pirin superfamily)